MTKSRDKIAWFLWIIKLNLAIFRRYVLAILRPSTFESISKLNLSNFMNQQCPLIHFWLLRYTNCFLTYLLNDIRRNRFVNYIAVCCVIKLQHIHKVTSVRQFHVAKLFSFFIYYRSYSINQSVNWSISLFRAAWPIGKKQSTHDMCRLFPAYAIK